MKQAADQAERPSKKNPAPPKARKHSLPVDEQVRGQLHALSQALDETARQYVLRLQREIVEMSTLIPVNKGKAGLAPREARKLREISDKFGALQIKPSKGRRKDLKRIDELIGELENLLQDA